MKLLKRVSFFLWGLLLLLLAIATILEKIYGTDFVGIHIYGSVSFVLFWTVGVLLSLIYIMRKKLWHQPITFLLHLSFLVVLTGALTTWLCGEQGTLRLRQGEANSVFTGKDGSVQKMPFSVTLDGFDILYYKGTRAPKDYISRISISDGNRDGNVKGEVAMNKIFSYKRYRFYQSGYDADGQGSVLSISHDPYGIGLTYTGYGLLLLSMLLFFFNPHSRFRELVNSPLLYRGFIICLFLSGTTFAAECKASATVPTQPKVLPSEVAGHFAELYILYNDRICPFQTFARDFTVKLYGKSTYRGLTSEQVLTGWMFYYDSWKDEPLISVKSKEVRRLLGIKGSYAALNDYADRANQYKLENVMRQIRSGEAVADKRGVEEANEKFDIISLVCTGALIKIFPYRAPDGKSLEWYAQSDRLSRDMSPDKWTFIRKAMNYVNEKVVLKKYDEVHYLLDKIKQYQQKECGGLLPADTRFKAEMMYNRLDYTRSMAIGCICIGVFAFLYFCRRMALQRGVERSLKIVLNVLLVSVFAYLSVAIALRGYVSGHLPLSNGFETMQFMAWSALLITFLLQRKFPLALPFGFLLCGLTLMVSMLGEANPKITQLMPVLASPLLSVHVVVIMIAYSLLAFTMLNGITAVIFRYSRKDCSLLIERLQVISRILLYPAVFLLTAGIFIGAVWANVSWGRYWGWDPKEVWALITMMIYAIALHTDSLPRFRQPMFFHVFCIVAFLSVLITYFGVNFLLGGMHSYANA